MVVDGVTVLNGRIVTANVEEGINLPLIKLKIGRIFYLTEIDTIFNPGLYVYTGTVWENVSNSGIISGVIAGDGIVGGGTSGTVTLDIDYNQVPSITVTDNLNSTKLTKSGDTMTGILDMGANIITNISVPVNSSDVTSKNYVDNQITTVSNTHVARAGDSMTGDLVMGGSSITSLASPIDSGDAVNKAFVDAKDIGVGTLVDPANGLTITNNNNDYSISIDYNQVASVVVTDNLNSTKLTKSGDTMTGILDMGANIITNASDPINPNDVTTKTYVDVAVNSTNLDLLPTSIDNNDGDFFIVVDTNGVSSKLTKSSINISQFNNDILYITRNLTSSLDFIAPIGDILRIDSVACITKTTTTGGISISSNDSVVIGSGNSSNLITSNVPLINNNTHITSETDVLIHTTLSNGFANRNEYRFNNDVFSINGSTFWHQGNDGSGSGLNADLIDGVHGSELVHTDGSSIMSNALIVNNISAGQFGDSANGTMSNAPVASTGIVAKIEIVGPTDPSHTQETAVVFHHRNTSTAVFKYVSESASIGHFNLISDDSSLSLKVDGNTVWHQGNDGSGSGLNADLLNNFTGSHYLDYNNFTNTPALNGNFVSTSGDTMTGSLNLSSNRITNIGNPTVDSDASTKLYVDTQRDSRLALSGGTLTGQLNVSTAPTIPSHVANKAYVDAQIGGSGDGSLPLTGGVMQGSINMDSFSIIGLPTPTSNQDITTKVYVDAQRDGRLALSGGTLTGQLVGTSISLDDGSASSPSYSFASNSDSGFFRSGSDSVSVSTAGTEKMKWTDSEVTCLIPTLTLSGSQTIPSYSFSVDTNTGLFRQGPDNIGFTTNGLMRLNVHNDGLSMSNNSKLFISNGSPIAPSLTFASDIGTGLCLLNTNNLGLTSNGILRVSVNDAGMDLNNHRISNVNAPLQDNDVATKSYVDGVAAGLDLKDSVKVATTANISLTGIQTVDGSPLSVNDRVLVKNQNIPSQNGIYSVENASWIRTEDTDGTPQNEVTNGLFCFVETGLVNSGTGWVLITSDPITVGTSDLIFAQFSESTSLNAGTGISIGGQTVSIDQTYTDNRYLNKSGDTVTGSLTLSTTPTITNHATNKGYVDSQRDTRLALSGGSMSGPINMTSSKITNVGTPTLNQDATNKLYVDSAIAGSNPETFRQLSNNTTAIAGEVLFIDTTSGQITVTLPSSPSIGDSVTLMDTVSNFNTSNCVVTGNGNNIMGLNESMVISNTNVSVTLIWSGNGSQGWNIRH